MKTLDFSDKNLENQQEVVKEEIRVNVKNRPYGLFFWTDLAGQGLRQVGERPRRLRLASRTSTRRALGDVEAFFGTYYGPSNAVLGDRRRRDARGRVREGREVLRRPSRRAPLPRRRTSSEALNTAERTLEQTRPARPRPRDRGRLQDAGPRQPRPRPGRGPRRPPRLRGGLAPLPGPREGQGAAPPDPGRRQLAARRRLDATAARPCSCSSASTSRRRAPRPWWTRSGTEVETRRAAGRLARRARPSEDEDAVGLLLRPRDAHLPRRRDRPRPAPRRRRRLRQRDPRRRSTPSPWPT